MTEIERKFLVRSDTYKSEASMTAEICQGFLNRDPRRTVRVRLKGDHGFITVKGMSNKAGTTRFEWEKEISSEEAEQLIAICEEGIIYKTRYSVPVGQHIIEVDEFHGSNQGLVIAEVELEDEDEAFIKPGWLGAEVTGDIRYYNSRISKHPYNTWNLKT